MARSMLLALFLALISYVLATPVNSTDSSLEKRITHYGDATWFYPGLGHCGYTDFQNDPIIALPSGIYAKENYCNRWLRIINPSNGKRAYGKVRDSCPSCNREQIDLSPSLFKALAPLDKGMVKVEWNFMAKGWKP